MPAFTLTHRIRDCSIIFNMPYNKQFVDELKDRIPLDFRKCRRKGREYWWEVHQDFQQTLEELLRKHWPSGRFVWEERP